MNVAFWAAALLSASAAAQSGAPIVVRVPATANPYLAGMPDGTRAVMGDRAPRESPVLVNVSLENAVSVSFRSWGGMDHLPDCPPNCYSPNGSEMASHDGGSENGISTVTAPINSLVGVFLGSGRPDKGRAPRGLNFERPKDFVSLSPELKQVFFIGTGSNKAGVVRTFFVPKGATRLFLGTMDGYEWNNNTGGFSVQVAVERSNVSSNMFSVDSSVAFAKWACLPDRATCTPEHAVVESRGPKEYHIVLPADREWAASIPAPADARVTVRSQRGTVCLEANRCNGPEGGAAPAGAGFLAPEGRAGALISTMADGRVYFSVNGRRGETFQKHEGYLEFDVTVE
jgi:hypothetical protein